MSFTVAFYKGGTLLYTFPTPTPFPSPKLDPDFDNFVPPRMTSLLKTWDIEGQFYGTEATAGPKWAALVAALTDPTNYPDEVRLIRGASTVVDKISPAQGFIQFKVEQLESPRSSLQWRGELKFRIRVSARLLFVLVGIGTNVTKLEQTETWNYAPGGLLTHTLTGKIQTVPGTSATTQAQSFGLQIPSDAFAFDTNGPGGVDVERQDLADTLATFTSVVRQAATSLPSGVAADYSLEVSTSTSNGETTSVTTVTAQGPGALNAVSAARPTGQLTSTSVKSSAAKLTAEATYVTRDTVTPGASFTRSREFTVSGGGRSPRFTLRTGDRDPAGPHYLPRTAVEIVETLVLSFRGTFGSGASDLTVPAPLEVADLFEDTDAMKVTPFWHRAETGVNPDGDLWELRLVRVYRAASISGLDSILYDAAGNFDSGSNLAAEFARKL